MRMCHLSFYLSHSLVDFDFAVPMESTQLLLNDQLVTITADSSTIKKLNENDTYLAEYVNRAAKLGQFHFLFNKDPSLRRIVVKRLPYKQVWCRKGRPTENDTAASFLLLKLRNSDKYSLRFKDGYSLKTKIWEEIASEMRNAGFDVDGKKCQQKFLNLVQNYQKNNLVMETDDFSGELKKVCDDGRDSDEDDEDWVPKTRKRMRKTEDDDDIFFKKFLKKNSELREERFKEMCTLIKKRNQLLEEKLKQNRDMITLLGKFVNN